MKSVTFFIFLCLTIQSLSAQDTTAIRTDKPFILGVINEIESKVLSEKRILNIYLPAGYNKNDSVKYPVIYLLDGSADEDFIHIAGLVQFSNFSWVNMLPNSILVGIANVDRKRDLAFPTTVQKEKKDFPTTGGSANFMQFIEEELQPFIDKNYKTTQTKTIIGQSLGGLFAAEILFKKPTLFTNYIIISPSLWWDNKSLLSQQPEVFNPGFKNTVSLFFAVGKEGETMEKDARALFNIFKTHPKKNITAVFEYFPDENHGTILHNAVYKAFRTMNKVSQIK